MVTETIKQEDVGTYDGQINDWIDDGIATYAIYVCGDKWERKTGLYSYTSKIRNTTEEGNINPLSKW